MVRIETANWIKAGGLASMEPCLFRHGKGGLAYHDSNRSQLQWSHVFSDMVRGSHGNRLQPASWELQWSHVFSDMVSNISQHMAQEGWGASMEPCLFRHGKSASRSCTSMSRDRLQWSHVFSDMVRDEIKKQIDEETEASMEPCLFRHGKQKRPPADPLSLPGLQWSHVFSDMVRAFPVRCVDHSTGLQWSHVFSDMVSICFLPTGRLCKTASMEPCLFRHGKKSGETGKGGENCSFNGAMSFQTW